MLGHCCKKFRAVHVDLSVQLIAGKGGRGGGGGGVSISMHSFILATLKACTKGEFPA